MSTNSPNSPTVWGQRASVPEPGIGQSGLHIGLITVDATITGPQTPNEGGIPATRDWTIYLAVRGNRTRLLAPNVEVTIRFGSGASAYTRSLRIPVLGAVVHVVSTSLSVEALVLPSGAPSNGNIMVEAFASPGRPTRTREAIAINLSTYAPGAPIPLPPFTTGVVVYTSIAGALGAPAVTFEYNNLPRGTYTPFTPLGRWSDAVGLPRDADSVSLTSIPPGSTFANILCEVDG